MPPRDEDSDLAPGSSPPTPELQQAPAPSKEPEPQNATATSARGFPMRPHLPEEYRLRKLLMQHWLFGGRPPKIGRFSLLEVVGVGAMSFVWAAYDPHLDRRVAVKLLRDPLAWADARLEREALAMARLSHPNVVTVYETGRWNGRLYIVMELVPGQTLDVWLGGRRRSWQEIVETFLQAGHGLAAAHAQGLVHRDFKPANVMVGQDGRVRVLDFGLVRLAVPAGGAFEEDEPIAPLEVMPESSGSLTMPGACVGTPAYMGPELSAGRVADARSDQYSFCVALHEALFGVRPGDDGTAPRTQRTTLALIGIRLSRVIERGLAKDPDARWPSLRHLLDRLEQLRWPARRWRQRATVLGMAALTVGAGVAGHHVVARERAALAKQADHQRALAQDARLVVAAQRLIERDPTAAAAALREVQYPDQASGWRSAATAVRLELAAVAFTGAGPDVMALRGHAHHVGLAIFSPEGGRVATCGLEPSVRIWDVSRRPTRILGRHDAEIWSAQLDAGGARLVTAGLDGTARIVLRGHRGQVRFAAFLREGRVVTASFDGTVRLWSIGAEATDSPALVDRLQRAMTSCLTADQRMQHLEEPVAIAAGRFADCERAAGRRAAW